MFDLSQEFSRTGFTEAGIDAICKKIASMPVFASVFCGDTKMSGLVPVPLVGSGYRVSVDADSIAFTMTTEGTPTHIALQSGDAPDAVVLAFISVSRDIDGIYHVGDVLTWDTCGRSAIFSLDGWGR